MKYALVENILGDWAVVGNVIEHINPTGFSGTVILTNEIVNWPIGMYSVSWAGKPKYISEDTVKDIGYFGYIRRNKLSVDFDNTLASNPKNYWPKVGKQKLIHKLVAAYVRYKKKQGWIIILNTMREYGKGLDEAVQYCNDHNIPIDYVNDNIPEDTKKFGYSRKIGCTRSIDDTQLGLIGWALRRFS